MISVVESGAEPHPVAQSGAGRFAALLLSTKAKAWHGALALTGLHFLITGWNLNLQHVISPDEPRYACAARHMLESGDYIVPYFNARPRLEKPVFFHWMLTISARVSNALGISLDTMGFRLVPFAMGLLVLLGLYLLSRRLLNPRGAFIAAVVLLTAYDFHDTSRELVVDMTLSACVMMSWLLFHIALGRIERREPALWPLLGMYVSLGCGCTTKGPFLIGIFFIVPVLAYLIWTRRLKLLSRAGLWWGVPLSVVIGFHWFVLVKQSGQDPSEFFAIENIARFFGRKDHIQKFPFYFYLRTLPLFFAPWAIFLPFAAIWTLKKFRDQRATLSDGAKLATCALGLSFLVIGTSVSKRHLYLIPLFPFLALWVAWFLERLCFSAERPPKPAVAHILRAIGAFFFLTALTGFVWLPEWHGLPMDAAICAILGTVILVASIAAAHVLGRGDRAVAMGYMLVLPLVLTFSMEAVRRPIHERELNLTSFYDSVRESLGDRRLVIMGTNSNEASWYLPKTPGPIDQIKLEEMKSCFFEAPGVAMLVSEDFLTRCTLLNESVRPLSGKIVRSRESFLLVEPNPDHPPDPALFKIRMTVRPAGNVDDL